MISALRRNLKALSITLWVVIAAFVGTSFFVWGKGSITGSDPTAVATVNGEEIPLERYQRLYRSYMEFYRQLYKERFTSEVAERLGISQQVVNDLILETLILQRANADGIQVGDDELRAKVQAIRAFQEDGRFSRERYRQILTRAKIDPATFETEQRRELVRKKMEAMIREGIKVSDMELKQAYDFRREKVRAAWAEVGIAQLMAEVSATEAELEAFLKTNPMRFQEPERRRLHYVLVSPRAFMASVTDADVEAYYKEHASEFEAPRRVRAAHILVRVPPVGGSEAEEKAKAKVEAAIKRARAGEDFAKLAREISEDPASAGSGGDLGYIGRGEVVPAFEQAVFALRKGEISPEPVRTPFGYHAIKVSEIQDGGRRSLKEVAGQIREKLQGERSERAALAKADEVKGALQGAKDFMAEAGRRGLEPKGALLARGGSLEEIGRLQALEDTLFSLAVGGVSSPLKTPAGYVIVKVVEQIPAAVPAFAEVKGKVAEAVKRQKAETLALARAKALAEAAEKGDDLLGAGKKQGLPSGDTGFFSRSEPAADRRVPGEVMRVALGLAVGKVAEPVATPEGVFVVKTLERRAPDAAGFEKEREELRQQVLEQKKNQAWEGWARGLRAEAKIQVSSGLGSATP
ncbi:MAG: SurA N-terminal domain-containing protein [Candidatus Rokubacteria bacterium]|nr:SurA N-terminal domain-containing protein [Candidatus Rokubacteria bacterium]